MPGHPCSSAVRPRTAAGVGPGADHERAPRFASPLVRRLAAERGLDARTLRGSGPGGVVRRCDLDGAPSTVPAADEVRIPLRGVRRAVADKLTLSRREIPEVTVWVDVDVSGLLEARAALRQAHPGTPVGFLALLARITVDALARFPELNSRVEGGEIVQSRAVHLGVAAQTDRGLVVPVLRDAHRASLLDLAARLADTTRLAREGALPPDRLRGGTFTLNNYGVFGVDGSTPIINHPEAAILGVGRVIDRPWAVDGRLEVRPVATLTLAFDHRVCDGGVAGGFLRHVADRVERPALLLASL